MSNLLDRDLPLPILPQQRARASEQICLDILSSAQRGSLIIHLPGGTQRRIGHGEPSAHWHIDDASTFADLLASSDIGLGESFMDGRWSTDNLVGLLTFLAENRDAFGEAVYGRPLRLLGHRLWHRLRTNSRAGSRRNIAAHYDLGNDFYQLWLDSTMSYSAALFGEHPERDLAEAQRRKYLRILEQINARPGQTILEIGCGWGGFAEVATAFGCRVRGVTLSRRQLAYAERRAQIGGWSEAAEFRYEDYRDIRGRFDHIVSIEMFEAVGERYWPAYFRQLRRLLGPGGRALVQTITIADDLFPRYRRGTDFIQRYIFPGGMLPAPRRFASLAEKQGFVMQDDFAFGRDYAHTLDHWLQRFDTQVEAVRALGYDESFIRMWRFYLAYCEAGFLSGCTDVRQFLLTAND